MQSGVASYYGKRYQGRETASGEIFDLNKFTAAHRSLPFGDVVRVTNLANGRSVLVRINDRGPFVGDRIVDLSLAAARQLDMIEAGVTQVRLEEVHANGRSVVGIPSRPDDKHLALLVPRDQRKPADGKSVLALP
jgi:rare lipoprotein A